MKIAWIHTLGCRLNTADAALLTDRLERAGYRLGVDGDGSTPELIVLNSCAVTGEASRKSRQAARQLRRRFPRARLVVTGCGAEVDRAGWEADGCADAILTNPEKRRIDELTGSVPPPAAPERSVDQPAGGVFREAAFGRFPFRSRAFLKIQEGCENFCTYCVVPYTRGPERSRAFDEVIADCRRALSDGFAELVLTGVNTARYRDGGRTLGDLVAAICALPGEFRVRLSSTEPHPSNRGLLEVLRGNDRVCRFLHLSLQHGADRILRRMNRHYAAAEFADFVAAAREAVPGISIGTDVIVGFPGETEEDFEESRALIRRLAFANTHLFRFSPRPGTPAAAFPDPVPPETAKRRSDLLRRDAAESRAAFLRSWIGRELPVIFETEHADGTIRGWSDNYIPFRRPAGGYPRHRIVSVTLSGEDCRNAAGEDGGDGTS